MGLLPAVLTVTELLGVTVFIVLGSEESDDSITGIVSMSELEVSTKLLDIELEAPTSELNI